LERISQQDSSDGLVREGRDVARRVLARAVAFQQDGWLFANGHKTVVLGMK